MSKYHSVKFLLFHIASRLNCQKSEKKQPYLVDGISKIKNLRKCEDSRTLWPKRRRSGTSKNNLWKLKGKSHWDRVSIVQDLTKIQCAEEKIEYQKLLEEQKQKNEENSENGVWKIVGSRGKKLLIFKYENP